MEAAIKVFMASGFDDTTMEAIAAEASVTKVTLYRRFPDKRSLLRAVLQTLRPQWTHASESGEDAESRLKGFARTILVQGVSPEVRTFNALVRSAWPDQLDMPSREEVLGYTAMVGRLEQTVLEGSKEFGLQSVDAAAVASALMAMLSGWFEHRYPDPETDAFDAERFASKAVELLIHGKAAW